MIENEVELTLEKLFTKPAQNPFSYNLNFDNPDKIHDYYYLFEQFKKIFVNGIAYTTDHQQVETENGKTILIDKVKKTYQVSLIMKFILKVWKRPIMSHMINLLIKRILIIYIK